MKKILIITGLAIIASLVIGVVKDQIIKTIVTVAVTKTIGAPVHIDGLSLGIFKQSVKIDGFKIYNPKGFPKGILVELATIYVDYDLTALFKKRLHLLSAEIELKEIGLIRDKEGKLNVDGLKVAKKEEKPSQELAMHIDILKLSIGRLVHQTLKDAGPAVIEVYDINIKKDYKNITSAEQLAALIVTEPMKAAGIKGASIYGVSSLAGVGIFPVVVAATLVGKDSAQADFDNTFDRVWKISLDVLGSSGKIKKEDRANSIISAEVDSISVSVRLKRVSDKTTQVIVSARKNLFPKPRIASGILYRISEALSK